jgi:hypothetical protein
MRPFVRAAVIFCILAFWPFGFLSLRAQQPPAPVSSSLCSQGDACKATEDAKTAAASATTAVTNAQDAAGTAQTAAASADHSAQAAKEASDAAAKAASDANAAAKAAQTLQSIAALRPPRPKRRSTRPPINDYVTCLFDDGEIYTNREVSPPPLPPTLQEGVPLDAWTAQTVAEAVKQDLVVQATSEVPAAPRRSNKETKLLAQKVQLENQKQIQDEVQQLIDPTKFVGKTLAEIPAIVTQTVTSAGARAELENTTASDKIQSIVQSKTFPAKLMSDLNKLIVSSKFDRPDDVACDFSVMQWKETSDNFGRRVANQYVALQVTVRNLNTQNEFVVHDIQIAVDTGLNRAQFGRFEAARDKLVVRNVAQRGQTEDRRNLIINTLQAAGAIAGGASTAVTQGLSGTTQATDLASAVAIFQGPFMTGVTNIFPDHTLEHINHINDLAFSASSTNKTVVPIQGSVPLVTFLSERPLEQLPFSRCGTSVKRTRSHSLYILKSDDPPDSFNPGSSSYQFCKLDSYDDDGNPLNTSTNFQPDYYMKPYHFKFWKAAALDVLKHRIFVVVGGVHIKEVAKQPTLSSIACDPGKDATLDLVKIAGPNATCTLKGNDLDLISQVSLQNATDTSDKVQAQGTSSVSGDATTADVTFLKSDLVKLKGTTYKLFYSLKGGGPQSTSLTVSVKQVAGLSTSKLDFDSLTKGATSAAKSVVVTNNGTDPLTFTVAPPTGANGVDFHIATNTCVSNPAAPILAGKDCTISLTFTPSNVAAETAVLTITYVGQGSPQTVELTGTGK